ncbi:class A beta-lactamase [Subtercola boreus]|uniref:class A beta-lactamase n=1 Tax=Subtercola boreus TaxID=120213 RepID=UPI00209C0E14|nr:class A beta-lactamase [Subtercola boreus]
MSAAVLTGCASTPVSVGQAATSASTSASTSRDTTEDFEELEQRYQARVGVYAIDTATGSEVGWRDDERFAYASTIKALAAAALLDQVGVSGLAKAISIDAADIVTYSPVTETRVGGNMTLGEIAEAALTVSDNTAANYLFEELGGPDALGSALTEIGDDTTVVSRIEPELNEAVPGDDRDTSTPQALATSLEAYVLGDALPEAEATQLESWMTATQTGDDLVRADLPTDWTVGDKSGSGGYGTRNDIAIVWPTEGAPIVIAVMSSRDDEDAESDDRLIAEAASTAIDTLNRVE